MDPTRFDTLVRSLAQLRSRRTALRLLAAGGLLAPLDAVAAARQRSRRATPAKRKKCKHGRQRCARNCIDVRIDPANCGACGHVCANDQTCVNGQCGCASLGNACEDASTCGCSLDCATVDSFKGNFPIPVCVSGDATVCCETTGAACAHDCDCCGTLRCSATSSACCIPSGETGCLSDGDCCSGTCLTDVVSHCA